MKTEHNYNRANELKAFDDTKDGVKGLVDASITEVPLIFHAKDLTSASSNITTKLISVPSVDLVDIHKDPIRRKIVVEKIREACEKWGFFQIVNHGIEVSVLEEMKNGVIRFFEQDSEVKRELYSRDYGIKTSVYNSNFDLYTSPAVNWRDSFYTSMAPHTPNPEELPSVCSDIMLEYTKHIQKVGNELFELLSEALGLNTNYLNDISCNEGIALACHYYPACPQPELTLGSTKHTDNNFITVLLQDHIGGLQVLHQNMWVDVSPQPGALVINIGDLLQLITNDKFKSVEHRVKVNNASPRVSIASFFTTSFHPSTKLYGPIKELVSEDNPPKYKATTVHDYVAFSMARGVDGTSPLPYFRIGS